MDLDATSLLLTTGSDGLCSRCFAGASQSRGQTEAALHHLGLERSSLAVHHKHGRHLLVDYKGSDPVGADTVGNGKLGSVSYSALAPSAVSSPLSFLFASAISLVSFPEWHVPFCQ